MTAEELIEQTKADYAAFSSGDIEGASANHAEDIEWIVPGNSAISGTYSGKDQVLELWGRLPEHFRGMELQHFFSDGERVVVLVHTQYDGGEADEVHVLTFRDDKLVKWQLAGDTGLMERLWGAK